MSRSLSSRPMDQYKQICLAESVPDIVRGPKTSVRRYSSTAYSSRIFLPFYRHLHGDLSCLPYGQGSPPCPRIIRMCPPSNRTRACVNEQIPFPDVFGAFALNCCRRTDCLDMHEEIFRYNMKFIACWNVEGALQSPCCMTLLMNIPYIVVNTVLCTLLGTMRTCSSASDKSIFECIFALVTSR